MLGFVRVPEKVTRGYVISFLSALRWLLSVAACLAVWLCGWPSSPSAMLSMSPRRER
jgi:hypothetical protein